MNHARSGELEAELGQPRAERQKGVSRERQRSGTASDSLRSLVEPGTRHASKCPTPLRLVGPRTVAQNGDWLRVFEVPVPVLKLRT